VRGSTSASMVLPFTFMETWDFAIGVAPLNLILRATSHEQAPA
jgi:hypothetical protein